MKDLSGDPQCHTEVPTIREVSLNPPFPPFNQAIVEAIRQWMFEPLIVRGQPRSGVHQVTVSIDLS